MLLLLLALALVGATVAQDAATNTTKIATHIITTSDRFRTGYPIVLLAEILKGTKPVTLTLSLTYKKYEANSTEQEVFKSSAVSVSPGAAQKLEFKIPEDIPTPENRWEGYYEIKVIGVGDEVSFNYSARISRDDKTSAILITSDKAIYKPGETVKCRILALDPDSLRVKNVSMNYTFTDPNENKMKIVQNAIGVATQGVVQDEFKLTYNTIRGDWKLTVEIHDQTEEYTFTVDEYVLPRYEVVVKLPPYCVSSDSSVPFTITAKYTYGQPVAGAAVSVIIRQYQPWIGAKSQRIIRTGELDENGAISMSIKSKELLDMIKRNTEYETSLDWKQIEVIANVTEDLTGRKQSGTAVTQFYQSRLKAEFLPNTPNNYKEGMTSTLFIEVKQRDDSAFSIEELAAMQATFNVTYEVPLTDEEWERQINETNAQRNSNSSDAVNAKIIMGGRWSWRPSKKYILELTNKVQTPTEDGFLKFSFIPPVGATSISIQVSFNKPYQNDNVYHYMGKSNSPSNSYLSIVAPTTMPQVGKDLTLSVVGTELLTHVTFEVISKGAIVDSGSAVSSTPGGSTSISITIKITQRMPPSITIAVYYIRRQNSEVVVDAMSLPVNGLFQRSVSMSFSPDKAEPGEPVDLVINAAQSSMVFVVANDKSAELIKSGNQMTQEKVQNTIATFAYGTFYPWFGAMFRCGFPYYNSGSDAYSVFQGANIIALSDGDVYRKPYDIGIMDKNTLATSAGGNAGFGGAGATANAPPKVRKNFPENWIWNVYTIKSAGGQYRETLTAPDTITKWNGYAFAVHETLGLSVIESPAELITFRNMFVEVTVPYSLIRNEQFCIIARVFNYYTKPLSVLLTFKNHPSFKNVFVKREGNSVTTTEENKNTAQFLQDIEPNDIGYATFCCTGTELGNIPINVEAKTNEQGLSDALEQQILIKPEGVEESVNYPSLPDLTTAPTWTRNIVLDFPADTVPGSQQVTASVTGNFLGPIFANIQDLVGKPYGCGEQNMLKFGPITYIHQFLIATKTITPEVEQKLKEYINEGFQTEQTYEHKTGGYSTFGEGRGVNEANSSTWLTGFVMTTYAAMQSTMNEYNTAYGMNLIDPIVRSAKFIISCQNENGSFTENGIVYHKDMQSGTGQGVALVAYTLIGLEKARTVLKNNPEIVEEITTAIKKSTSYLIDQLNGATDSYTIIIATYVLHLLNDPNKERLFNIMESLSINKDGRKSWGSGKGESRDVEMTAYALLIYCLRGISQTSGLPIIIWLSDQRGTKGGFVTTQVRGCFRQFITPAIIDCHCKCHL